MEKNLMTNNMLDQNDPNRSNRTANAFTYLSASPSLNLIHRYESRLQRIMQRAMDNLLRLREDDRREEAWTEENAPLPEVPGLPTPVAAEPPRPPTPPSPTPEPSSNPMNNNDLEVEPTHLKPIPPNRLVSREQKMRNEANSVSGDPAEVLEIAKPESISTRRRPIPSGNGRF